jgi:hypothetical protein
VSAFADIMSVILLVLFVQFVTYDPVIDVQVNQYDIESLQY